MAADSPDSGISSETYAWQATSAFTSTYTYLPQSRIKDSNITYSVNWVSKKSF